MQEMNMPWGKTPSNASSNDPKDQKATEQAGKDANLYAGVSDGLNKRLEVTGDSVFAVADQKLTEAKGRFDSPETKADARAAREQSKKGKGGQGRS
ncbi:hypothetical protein ACXC9Q_11685 [Kribbella sp. CWNU-51]